MTSQEIIAILNALPITDAERTKVQNSFSTATHGTPEFNFTDLEEKFTNVCTDYKTELQMDTVSFATEFCSKMVHEVGPEARKVTKSGGNKEYSFHFDKSVALVSTSSTSEIKYDETTNSIHLSVEQAMLLAINKLEKINNLISPNSEPVYLLTPLASAIFCKRDIPKMSAKLGVSQCDVAHIINASSVKGGWYLRNSTFACAAVSVIVSTRTLKDKDAKIRIISNTLGGYLSQKKKWDVKAYEVFTEFTNDSRIPDAETMINMFESIQLEAKRAREAALIK